MALIVEDGSNVQNSETFVSEADFIDFCGKRGVSISDTTIAAINLVKAMDLLSTYEGDLKGERTTAQQSLMYPRKGVRLSDATDAEEFPSDQIPAALIRAQMHAALYAFEGITLLPVQQNGSVLIRKKTAVLEKEWAFDPNASTVPTLPQVDSCLSSLLKDKGMTGYVTVYRA